MKLRGSSRFNVFLLFPLHPCVGRKEQGGHCVTLCGIFCQQTLVNKVWMSHFFVILVSSNYCVEMTDQTRSDSTIICKSLPPFLSCFHPFTWLCSGSIVLQNIHVVIHIPRSIASLLWLRCLLTRWNPTLSVESETTAFLPRSSAVLCVRVRAHLNRVNDSAKPGAHARSRRTWLCWRLLGFVNSKPGAE